jgi:5-methylcytosine-specific restriction endonuclease McrA
MSDEYVMSTAAEVEPVINKSDGLSSNQILHICQKNDISMYGFDQSKKCFIKHISKSRNSKALVYYLCNTHMYLVRDSNEIKSLVESSKSIEQKLNSVCLQDDKEKENIFDSLPVHEDLKIEEMMLLKESSIIIYNQSSLNDLHKKFMNMGLVCKLTKVRKTTIIKMQYTKVKATENSSAIVFHMYADTNDYTQELNHKVVKELCDLTKTKFSNQTFPSLIRELKTQFFNTKVERKRFTKDERQKMINETKVCQNIECKKELVLGNCEIDHVIPLSAGGKDDASNLQLLCKGCHGDKTSDEQQNDGHVQHSQTYSSFNNATEAIFESPLTQSLAFIETVNEYNVDDDDDEEDYKYSKMDRVALGLPEKNKFKILVIYYLGCPKIVLNLYLSLTIIDL